MAKKETNENIGTIDCPSCTTKKAFIRRYKTGKKLLYTWCEDCGTVRCDGQAWQNRILETGKINSPADKPEIEEEKKPAAKKPDEKKPENKSIFARLWHGDGQDPFN